jgi:sec-independent protein translocase protein TatC
MLASMSARAAPRRAATRATTRMMRAGTRARRHAMRSRERATREKRWTRMRATMDDADASRARADEDVWPDADFATGEGDARTSGEGASASETFKTSLTDDPAFAMALRAEEDESVEMVPLASAAVTTVKKKRTFVEAPPEDVQREQVRSFLYPGEDELPDDVSMTIWEHLEELRERALISAAAVGALILVCFCFAKDLTIFLEEPVKSQGVRFLQLGPGEYFFTTVKVAGYTGLLAGAPVVLYEAIAYVLPGLTLNERKTLGPIVIGSSVLFYGGIAFAYYVLVPAALKFFVGYADGAVESLWSIDQYFEFVLVLLFSTGLSFQVPVIQLLLGQSGIVSSKQMLSVWKYVVVGSVVAAAVLTPSTDPFTQMLLAVPLMSLYLGGAALVGVFEKDREGETA